MQTSKTESYIDEHRLFWFRINRPEKRNAIDYDVMNDLEHALGEAQANPLVRAFIITGAGEQSFCSGGDLSVFHSLYTKEDAYAMLSRMGAILYKLMTLPLPTYALINGTAIGGGCEIASACDQRWAMPHARMGFVQGDLGITTGWGGASMLFEKVPSPQALQMLNSANIYTAVEAERLGFIQKVLEKSEVGSMVVESLVESSAVLRSYKQALKTKWEQTNLKERMLAEIEQCAYLWEQDEHHMAVARFLQSKKK